MMSRRWIGLVGVIVLVAGVSGWAADVFPTAARRQAFLKALAKQDQQYDPQEHMLRSTFSSPGYHTTLSDGQVHRTRESLVYAVALLDAGDAERRERAVEIIKRVLSLQDKDPSSRTYGIWPWFLEESLDQMSPPDWNWADFCGTQLLQIAIDHGNRLDPELRGEVHDAILHAARSIMKRNVGPSYTNIALMGAYVTLVAGERLGVRELADYGEQRLRRFYDYTEKKGSFSEYNSPTYTRVAIEEISRMRQHVRDMPSRALLDTLNDFAWYHLARHFHSPTLQWAGPHSRSYATLLRPDVLAFIQRATSDDVRFMTEPEAWESITAQRIELQCPAELEDDFLKLEEPREETEAFVLNPGNRHSIIGTTYLAPAFTLGSVNIGDLWNQRRPLVAYWNTAKGVGALRLRCLHDNYDYASASLFTLQEKNELLGAVVFATDRGDTHISLDRLSNGTITARDMRVRLQFEGDLSDLVLPKKVALEEPIHFTSGKIGGTFCVHQALFGDYPIRLETGRDSETAWIDVILYRDMARRFNFNEIEQAAVVFTLALVSPAIVLSDAKPNVSMGVAFASPAASERTTRRQKWTWQRINDTALTLTIPITPLPTKVQTELTTAQVGPDNPWNADNF